MVTDEGFDTPGLGRALDVELASTPRPPATKPRQGIGLGLIAEGRGAVEEVGRFGLLRF